METLCAGEPGKPLFVSALVYLNHTWPDAWDAETLFLDGATGTGAFVRPRPGRLVLMVGYRDRVVGCGLCVCAHVDHPLREQKETHSRAHRLHGQTI